MTTLLLATALGAAFGAVLDRIGATSPSIIGRMLSLADLTLMKTILLAIGGGSVLMFSGQMLGIVDVLHMSVKSAYTGVFIGGLMLGIGWAASGYCPGTGVAAAATGRKDALFFIAGGLLGAGAYTALYADIKATGILDPIGGGAVTLGAVPGSRYDAVFASVPGDVLGILIGAAFIAIAFALPERPSLRRHPVAAE